MSKEKNKRRIRQATAAAAALLLAAAFTFPSGTEIMGIGFGNAIVASAAQVASGTCGTDLKWVLDDSGTLTISYTGSGSGGSMKNWAQLDYYKGKIPWAKYKDNIKSVVIGDKVTSIGDYAFYRCSNITSVDMGSVTSIGKDAFKDCTSLSSITIPDSVTSIGESAFWGCSNLTSITIPDSVNSIGNQAFSGCSSLSEVTISDGVTSIGDQAFSGCKNLSSITIPSGVTSIGNGVFANCNSLSNIIVDEGNTMFSSGNGVLFDKNKTKLIRYPINKSGDSYDIPNSVTSIGAGAFASCKNLASITIPSSVTAIESDAFFYCTSLTSITIPDSVNSIGYYAFEGCKSLTSITIPDGVNSIGEGTFSSCTSLESITIPDGVNSIGDVAFKSCTSLTSITIPDSVNSIGEGTFRGCTSLTSITIPDSVNSIGYYAFEDCKSLTSIAIPDGVNSIGEGTFSGCTSLTSIAIPDGVNSIGEGTFSSCTSLTSITIPGSVNSIGYYAFNNCTSLTSIAIPDSVNSIGDGTFSGCTSLTSITIPDSVNSIGNFAFESCEKLESIFLPESLSEIAEYAIPETAAQIKYSVSGNNITITEITLGTGQTSVDLPEAIGGYPIAAVAAEQQSKVGSHTHYYDSNNTCTICGFTKPNKNEKGYYEITNADQLFWFAQQVNDGDASANAILTASITVNDSVLNSDGTLNSGSFKSWTPIGYITNKYTGTFDGNGNTISGLYFNDSDASFVGLFGYSCGTIKNVGVVDSYFTGKSFVGGVCGSNGSDLLSGTIESCYNTGKVNGSTMVGGICGQSYNSAIQKCYNTGDVNGTGSNVGGICGANDKTLENCYNTGAVSGTDYVGGLCGEAEWSSLGHSYNIGKISAAEGSINVGELYGHMGNGEIGSCFYLADSEIDSDRFDKTADEFASGEVAFLLQGEQDEAVWGQTIGTENYPVFGGVKVYRNETYKGCAGEPGDPTYSYSNTEEKPVYAEHKLSPVNEKAATCTEDGNIEHYKCSVCGKLFTDSEGKNETTLDAVTIPAAHKLSPVEAKDATCTEDGNTKHYKCDVCGKLFADENAEKEITLEEVTFPKSGHSKDEGIVNKASLTANSITISYNCPVCGEYIGEETVSVTITNVEVTSSKVVVSYTITETSKARTLEYTLDEVTAALVDIMKSSNIQLVIDFVNSFTAADTDGILTDAQLKAIEYVLAYDFG